MSKIPFNPRRIYPRDCQEWGSLLCINGISITFLKALGIAEWFFLKMKVLQFPCSVLLILKKCYSSNFWGLTRTRCYSGLKIIYLLSNRTKLSAEHHSLYILFTWPFDIASNNQHSWSPFLHNMTMNFFNHWSQRYPQYLRSILRSHLSLYSHLRPQFGKYLADLSLSETLSVFHTPLFSVSMSPL